MTTQTAIQSDGHAITTSQQEPREVLKHVAALDGIRGLAILVVLCHHLLLSNDETSSRIMNLVVKVRAAGWVGVDLFFALSGFLITGILYDSLHDRHFFKNFYMRRVLRIFPLYYGIILVLFAIFHAKLPLFLLLGYLQNTPLWWHRTGGGVLIEVTGHLWSLAVEEQFYMVWPLIVFFVRDRRKLVWITVAISIAALLSRIYLLSHGQPLTATYKLTFCRADSLLAGAWLALVVRGAWKERVLRMAVPVFLMSVAVCAVIAWKTGGFYWENNRAIGLYGYSVLAIGSTALIAMALRPLSLTAKMMRVAWLRFLGKYSYGIYIYHQMIGPLLAIILGTTLQDHIHSKALNHLASLLLIGGVTILVAVVSYNVYERPFLKLKRFFNYGNA